MTRPLDDFTELRALLDAVCEEVITPEQMRRLEELILNHPEAEAFYVQYMHQHADLAGHFAVLPAPTEETLARHGSTAECRPLAPREEGSSRGPRGLPSSARPRRSTWGILLGLTGLAAGLLLALVLLPRLRRNESPTIPGPVPTADDERLDDSVAVLLHAPGSVWGKTQPRWRPGAPLRPGWLRLQAGFAHIEFYSGAAVILEGPADLRLISPREAYCARGKLRATVPPQAEGFTIRSPKLDLVDRGTEFGLRVKAGGNTEVHVFQGKVELYAVRRRSRRKPRVAPRRKPDVELTTGRGLRLDRAGSRPGAGLGRPIKSDPAAFRTAQQLAAHWEAEAATRQRDWLTASRELRRDPTLLVYYPFQAGPAWSRQLPNRAAGRGPWDGVIVGCSWVTGRWPGKHGLEFKRVSDRVRFHLAGEFDALTLAAWVRVDDLPNVFNSLMMTDGWLEAAPHWHISNRGKLELGVQGFRNKGGVHYYSPPVFTAERLGQWTHLAVVYDRDGRRVTHYVDGRVVSREALKLDIPLRLGNAELGNWNVGFRRHNHPIRYFNGCIDEFMLFSRALGPREVERLYTQGRPPF
jgi:hypothetical protein